MIWPWLLLVAFGVLGFICPYVVYPLVLRLKRRRFEIGRAPLPAAWPSVSFIVAACNAAGKIGPKVRQLREHDYSGSVEIVVADDGSSDDTANEATQAGADQVLRLPRAGKSEAQNQAVEAATGEVLIFTDATVEVLPGAVGHLVAELMVEGVGCVTGVDVSVAADRQGQGQGQGQDAAEGAGFYTRFETYLRKREAETGTLIGVNGCLFAVRKTYRPSVPPDCVDDLYVPLAVCDRGLRVTVHPEAKAVVPRSVSFADEYRRKVRTFTGGIFTMLRAYRHLPRAHRRLQWRLFGHKWSRWVGPMFLLLAAYGSVGLAFRWPLGWLLVAMEIIVTVLAGFGIAATAAGHTPARALRLPAFIGLVQLALVHAWYRMFTGQPYVTWKPTRREF